MIEIYILIAVVSNILADIAIWREVSLMKSSAQRMEENFMGFFDSLGGALTDHAKLTTKGIMGAIGHYQGKAQKAAEGEIEGLSSTLEALGPLAKLISQAPAPGGDSGGGKFHM